MAVDVTAFWRPRLRGCPTAHYHAQAGRALPAIPVGIVARVGGAGGQRLALPLALVRADPADPRAATHERLLVRAAVQACAADEALVLDAGFGVVAVYDPRFREPLLLASPLPLPAKQMVGAARQFVHAPEARVPARGCRLPELALLAGAILSYAAATGPAVPTGFRDRRPVPTPGRLRRALARCPFAQDFPLPPRIRVKTARTDHLPTGSWGQRRRPLPAPDGPAAVPLPPAHPEAA